MVARFVDVRRRLLSASLACCLVSTAASADPIDDYIRAQMRAFHLPGVAFAIVENGRLVRTAGFGVADLARQTPATPDTVFKIGSVSKQFIATGIMLLAQDGRLNVNDPLSRYLEGTPEAWKAITIRHLLTHTGGLVRESPAFDPMKASADRDVVSALYALPLRFPPGSKWEYSNAGYYALAEIVTRTSGTPWTEFLHERVFAPAGMRVTAPTNVTPTLPNRALGYTGNDNQQRAPEWVALRPSGAFLSTVGDLARWDALLDTDRILTEASRREMWTPVRLSDGTTYPYGFGWHAETRDGRRVVWHGGGLPGFTSYFGRWLDERVTVILLTNGDDVDVAAVASGLANLYLKSR
jgi:CubicO group peptidase (beta-lactamase class C family)